jgi:hypothetical protein
MHRPIALAVMLASCASPVPLDAPPAPGIEETLFEGRWSYRITPMGTREGPEVALPSAVYVGEASITIDDGWVFVWVGDVRVAAFRVASRDDGRVRADWSTDESGAALSTAVSPAVVMPTLLDSIDDEGRVDLDESVVPLFRPGHVAMTTDYDVATAGCDDPACHSIVRVRHQLDRIDE